MKALHWFKNNKGWLIPVGFLLGSTSEDHTKLLIIDPIVTKVHTVAGASVRRLLGGNSVLELGRAAEGIADWQLAATVIGKKR